jgi:hypothetical protein
MLHHLTTGTTVIPAQAGPSKHRFVGKQTRTFKIYREAAEYWVPAFAGMKTDRGERGVRLG